MNKLLNAWRNRREPTPDVPRLALTLALHTDTGPVRERNEDCIAALTEPDEMHGGERTALVVLADGMGGHQAGQLASRLAVDAALQSYGRCGGAARERLQLALAAANTAVHERAQLDARWQGMGTTLLLFAPQGQSACFAWVGDSRLYRGRDGRIEQLTRDDTVVQGLLDRGLIDAAEAARHPEHSVLTQAVGTHAQIPAPHVEGPIDLRAGDRFLLCSDGVHDVVDEAALAVALGSASPHAAVRAIHALALAGGADDNLSIGVIHLREPTTAIARTARATRSEVEVMS
jgi:PPM family protein phosphatase